MNYKVTNDFESTDGTFLQGYLNVDYKTLVEKLGQPDLENSPGSKIDAEWVIEFEDGTVSTIYNWKNGPNYLGPRGQDIEKMVGWNVGGLSRKSFDLVDSIFND